MVYEGIIRGSSVVLRAVEEKDAEITFQMRNDPNKAKFISKSSSTVEAQLNFIKQQREKEGDYLFIVEDLQGKVIGMKGVYNHNPHEKKVETGRFLSYGTPVQNTEALLLSFDFAFDVLKCDKIHMSALEKNTVMRNMQNRFGVVVTHKTYDETFQDYHVFSVLTKENYNKVRQSIVSIIDRFALRDTGEQRNG